MTMEIIKDYFGFNIDAIKDPQTFYKKYIAFKSIEPLKQAYQKISYSIREPLLSIFSSIP